MATNQLPNLPGLPGIANLPGLPGELVETAVAGWAQRKLAEQPWYKAKSNTLTGGFSAFVTLAWTALGTGLSLPSWAVYGIAGVLFVGNLLGLNATKNGMTASTAGQVQQIGRDPAVMAAIEAQLGMQVQGRIALNKAAASSAETPVAARHATPDYPPPPVGGSGQAQAYEYPQSQRGN